VHIHILGICGTFMGGIAAIAREAGHKVTGCDANVYPPMSDPAARPGHRVDRGLWRGPAEVAPDVFVVGNVVTRARSEDFALMEAILDAGANYTSGPQWLAEHVLQGRHVLAGRRHARKTSNHVDARPGSSACRAAAGFPGRRRADELGVSARLGGGRPFVIEADE
jgi:UDP-N-acetylmuramate: L-alanyl-gamma-D-glutamyl-meso-diaminopimelate ligase